MKKSILLLFIAVAVFTYSCTEDDSLASRAGWVSFTSAYSTGTFYTYSSSGGFSWLDSSSQWSCFFFEGGDISAEEYIYVALDALNAGTRTDSGFSVMYKLGSASYWNIGTTGNTVTISENTGSRIRGTFSVNLKDIDTGDTIAATGSFDSGYEP